MKSKEFFAGILVGAVVFGGSTALASGVVATLSSCPICVDEVPVSMTAYLIDDTHYVRLRDIGQAMDFGVTYDSTTGTVYLDSTSSYTEEVTTTTAEVPQVADMVTITCTGQRPTGGGSTYTVQLENETYPGKLSNGLDATEEHIMDVLAQFAELFPDGTSWGSYLNDGDIVLYQGSQGCNSYAYLLRDILYGSDCEPCSTHSDLAQVHIGDVIHLKNNTTGTGHWIVVSGVEQSLAGATYLKGMSGNTNQMVSLDTSYYLNWIYNSYPDSIVYSYTT